MSSCFETKPKSIKRSLWILSSGLTLYSIAKNNNLSIDTLIKDNALTNNNLTIGQTLKIRIPSNSIEIEECFGTDYTPPTKMTTTTYTVKKGDNLYNIAKQFNTNVSDIITINNLTNNNLSIGQQLKIPNLSNINTQNYTVKKGDSLYTIAKKFNTTIEEIKRKNNLTSNLLSIGQKLII